ncbi:cobalamin-binding protein [Longibacter salinarum]|uniref:Cobalamin-binding protein n=1 Tax=Longibacter salinarum TaxID=1850348 RepID=A0A2A8CU52_9BACT|nr:helical backbone metal receptor [Longibacter salinarum]PEN10400.1 cobalamin-binding protein [Longibacter salinarum]
MLAAFFSETDQAGRRIRLPDRPKRIVSLVPSITELLYDLKLGERVAGITRFCERPGHWRDEKVIVGGTKNVKQDTIAELEPDLVLANLEENEQEDVEAINAPVYVTDIETIPDAVDMIRTVGQLTDTVEAAQVMADTIAERFASLQPPATIRAAYLIWCEPYMSVGHDTFIHDVMTRAGFENVFAEATRYPEVSISEIAEANPDVVLCSSEPFPFHQKERFTQDIREAIPDTPVEIVDGQLFSWYGSRLLDAPDYLRDLIRRLDEKISV